MLPVGPLMQEHRVIERLMPLIRQALDGARREGAVDPRFLDLVLDFLRTYADRCHHGKEENLLFRTLQDKPLTAAHRAVLNELLEEHRQGRAAVGELARAAEAYRRGEPSALGVVIGRLEFLAAFYPAHILKEDRSFFLPVMDYLSAAERSEMIEAEREFDRALIHAVYREKVAGSDLSNRNVIS